MATQNDRGFCIPLRNEESICYLGLFVSPGMHYTAYCGTGFKSTSIELRILYRLVLQPHRYHSRSQLLDELGFITYNDLRTIDSHISRLRRKLKKIGAPAREIIRCSHGAGYKIWSRSDIKDLRSE